MFFGEQSNLFLKTPDNSKAMASSGMLFSRLITFTNASYFKSNFSPQALGLLKPLFARYRHPTYKKYGYLCMLYDEVTFSSTKKVYSIPYASHFKDWFLLLGLFLYIYEFSSFYSYPPWSADLKQYKKIFKFLQMLLTDFILSPLDVLLCIQWQYSLEIILSYHIGTVVSGNCYVSHLFCQRRSP